MIKKCSPGYNPLVKENLPSHDTLTWCRRHLDEPLERVVPLRVEASNRLFYRLELPTGSVILMCSPPMLENNVQFRQLAIVFRDADVPVPAIIAESRDAGWFLLEDLGATHLEDAYASTEATAALGAAIDMLPRIGSVSSPLIPTYDVARLQMELGIFTEWLVEKMLGLDVEPNGWQPDFERLIAATQEQPQGCTHRDYHCRNLLWRDGRLGIVDFQDALVGPCLYDLASLLRDCYYTFSEAEIDQWLQRFIEQEPRLAGFDSQRIKRWFDLTAIQRQLKAIGIFARLHLRDGKSSHLSHIQPVLARILALLEQYPEFTQLDEQLNHCKSELTRLAATPAWVGLRPAQTALSR